MVSRNKQCPVDGCAALLTRSRAVRRDERLREQLQRVPTTVDSVRVCSSGELGWDAPRVAGEANTVDLTIEGQVHTVRAVAVKGEPQCI